MPITDESMQSTAFITFRGIYEWTRFRPAAECGADGSHVDRLLLPSSDLVIGLHTLQGLLSLLYRF